MDYHEIVDAANRNEDSLSCMTFLNKGANFTVERVSARVYVLHPHRFFVKTSAKVITSANRV